MSNANSQQSPRFYHYPSISTMIKSWMTFGIIFSFFASFIYFIYNLVNCLGIFLMYFDPLGIVNNQANTISFFPSLIYIIIYSIINFFELVIYGIVIYFIHTAYEIRIDEFTAINSRSELIEHLKESNTVIYIYIADAILCLVSTNYFMIRGCSGFFWFIYQLVSPLIFYSFLIICYYLMRITVNRYVKKDLILLI